jgi:hypothetical protein
MGGRNSTGLFHHGLDLGQADLPPSGMLAVAMLQLIHHLCHIAQNPVAAEFPSAGPETAMDSTFTHCLRERGGGPPRA